MKHSIFKLIVAVFVMGSLVEASAQCLPNGIHFNSQSEIDNFAVNYPGCELIEGGIIINGTSDITNLNGLSQIREIGGSVSIQDNPNLISLNGLNGLESIGGALALVGLNISNLSGLEELTHIGEDLYLHDNPLLQNVSALANLTEINRRLSVQDNLILTTLDGLDNISTIGYSLQVTGNNSLQQLNLTSLTTVEWGMRIYNNPNIQNFEGLENLTTLGSPTSVGGLIVESNHESTTLDGLESLTTVYYDVLIGSNVTDLNGLSNLNTVTGSFSILNTKAQTLDGLESLVNIDLGLSLRDNASLTNIEGLRNVNGSNLYYLYIQNNTLLSDCAIQNVCDFISANPQDTFISDNAIGCANIQEVEDACLLGIDENALSEISIFPNPTSNMIFIEGISEGNIAIMDASGRIINSLMYDDNSIDLSGISEGMYFMKISSEGHTTTKRIVKN